MTEIPSDDDLQLTPEEEPERPMAPEEPYRADMILVPVYCSACRMRYYAQEKHIGLWSACPDCGRINEIRPPDPGERVITTQSSAGTIQIQKLDDIRPNPVPRVNVDYRTVEGSVDKDAEILPMYGLDETSEDELENWVDRFLEKDPNRRLSPGEIRYRELTKQRQDHRREEDLRRQKESPQEHRQRLADELQRARSQRAKTLIRQPSAAVPPRRPSVPKRIPPRIEQKPAPAASSPWKSFLAPVLDRWQKRRFAILFLSGIVAMMIFSGLGQYLGTAFDPTTSTSYSFFIFCLLWFLADVPLALWMVMVVLSGITLFEATKDGENTIRRWILFRTDLAMHYVGWLFLLALAVPFPGALFAAVLRICHVPSLIPPGSGLESMLVSPFRISPDQVNNTAHILLGGIVSAFLLFPVVFLLITSQDTGRHFFDRQVFKSILRRPFLWLGCYLAFFLLFAVIWGAWFGIVGIADKFAHRFLTTRWPVTLLLGGIAVTIITGAVLTFFRLLGCLAWSVFNDSANVESPPHDS